MILSKLKLLVIFLFVFLSASAQTGSCNTWTFTLQLGSSSSENPSEVIAIPGGYLIAGNDSAAAGTFGRLIKLDGQGNVLQSKELKMGTAKVSVKKLKFIYGNLYALGEEKNASGQVTTVLFKIDPTTLGILSALALSPSAGSWNAADLDQWTDSTIGILTSDDSLVNVTRIGMDGSVRWSKSYKTGSETSAVNFRGTSGYGFVTCNIAEAGVRKGVLLYLNDNGTEITTRVVGSAGDEYIFQSLEFVLGSLDVTGARISGGNTTVVRLPLSVWSTSWFSGDNFTIGNFTPGASVLTGQGAWSQVLAASMPNSTDMQLIFTFPGNYNTPISARTIRFSYPVSFRGIARTDDGGSLVVARKEGTNAKIVLVKVDSTGMLAGCPTDSVPASFQSNTPDVQVVTFPVTDENCQAIPVTVTVSDWAVTEVADCRNLYCPVVPEPPVCEKTFFKKYDTYTHSNLPRQLLKTSTGQLLVSVESRNNPYHADVATNLLLFDTAGNVVKSKVLNGNLQMYLDKITQLGDGGIAGVGEIGPEMTAPYSKMGVIKLDPALNILWQKAIHFHKTYEGFFDVTESAEGDLYCYVEDDNTSIPEKRQLLKLDASGNPVWFREYDAGPSLFPGTDERYGFLVDLGNYIYMNYNREYDWSPHILKISKADGSIAWDKQFGLTTFLGSNINIDVTSLVTDGTALYMSVRGNNKNVLLKVNSSDGNLEKSLINTSPDLQVTNMIYRGKGRLVLSGSGGNGTVYGILDMDTSFKVLQKQFLQLPRPGVITSLANYDDSVNFATGNFYNPDNYVSALSFEKYNFESSFTSCQVTNPMISFKDIVVPLTDGGSYVADLPLPSVSPTALVPSTGAVSYQAFYCGNQPMCNSISVSGPSSLCDSGTYHYSALRNPGCDAHVNWIMNASTDSVEVIAATDTSIDLHVIKGGLYHLKAKIFGSCTWYADSMDITAAIQAYHTLNLGPDTTLCPGNTLMLDAGSGFSGYRWQDGSTDTSFTVTQPGTYFVMVQAGCNAALSDTVVVVPHPPIPFEMGPDTFVCRGNTISLAAQAGFTHYQWTPGNDSTRVITASPLAGTLYKVQAKAEAGCTVSDSLFVQVKGFPVISLGNDTSFCQGQSISLDAGAGFDSYAWSTGETSRAISARSQGTYTVTGTLNGCSSSDSLSVLNVFPLPSFSLGPDTTLCEGQFLYLSIGIPNASFLWSTGSTSGSFTVTQQGKYWLQVTQQGCSASDSITVNYQVTSLVQLGPDTTICEGTSLTLSAYNNNATYLWQDGSTGANYEVTGEGIYSVVASIGSCRAGDTIAVNLSPKPSFTLGEDQFICTGQELQLAPLMNVPVSYLWQDGSTGPSYTVTKAGIYALTATGTCGSYTDSVTITMGTCNLYMPNAFTPNGDGLNDLFRVKYVFPIKSFVLRIYDRFGEKVFESGDIHKGWDGTFKGEPALAGAYVWTITLVSAEGKPETGKGVVTLVR